jgi:hypothetical protein
MPTPLLKDEIRGDAFQRGEPVATLLRTLHRLPPPGCIALYGSWGAGKTTVLRQVYGEWQEKGQPAVWFDPWEYERRQEVLVPLVHEIVRQTQTEKVDKERLKWLAAGILRTLLSLGVQLAASYYFGGLPAPASDLRTLKLDDITKNFGEFSRYQDEIQDTKKSFKELVELLLGARDVEDVKRLVVFLDDVDRCLPDNVVMLLEGIKLLLCGAADCPVLFVFGLDRQVVGEAIAARYPGSTSYTGESYLEKIFDVSIEVPPVQPEDVQMYVDARAGDMTDLAPLLDLLGRERLGAVLGSSAFANPRLIKRVLNRLLLLATHPKAIDDLGCIFARCPSDRRRDAEKERFVAWVAGIERFRAFRVAFADASTDELAALHGRLRGGTSTGLGRFAKIVDTPSFARYYELLCLTSLDPAQVVAQRNAGDRVAVTLRDYDDLLRRAGL